MRSAPRAEWRSAGPHPGREEGSATAEFAVVLPSVLLVLGLALGGLQLAAQRLVLASAASDIARASARGDPGAAERRLADLAVGVGVPAGVQRSLRRDEDLLCVTLTARPGTGILSVIALRASGCALETRP